MRNGRKDLKEAQRKKRGKFAYGRERRGPLIAERENLPQSRKGGERLLIFRGRVSGNCGRESTQRGEGLCRN